MNPLFFFLARAPSALSLRVARTASTCLHRAVLDKVGSGTQFYGGCRVFFPGHAEVGADCLFDKNVRVGADIVGCTLKIGNNVQINRNVHLDVSADLTIEDDVVISEEAVIYTHDHGLDPKSKPRGFAKRIGRGAWIGRRAIVMPSCTEIGEGAVIGAGAIITRNLTAHTIVAGNPARIIGTREERIAVNVAQHPFQESE